MPLSEHEQEILAQIERQLAADDPRFVARARREIDRRPPRLWLSVVGFVLGLLALFGLTFSLAFGVLGFAVMLVSVVTGARALKGRDLAGRLTGIRSSRDA